MQKTIIALIFCLLSFAPDATEEPFVWADDEDYGPYVFAGELRTPRGIFVDVMVEVFERIEKPLKVNLYPWKRAQKLVEDGQADGMITLATQDRMQFLVASDPIIHSQFKVHTYDSHPKRESILAIQKLRQLGPYTLIDYLGDGWAEENLAGYDVIWAPNYTSAVWMLAKQRGDIFLDDPLSIAFHVQFQTALNPAKNALLLNIIEGEHALYTVPLTLMVRKDSDYARMLPQINQALAEMKQDGTIIRILDKHGRSLKPNTNQ